MSDGGVCQVLRRSKASIGPMTHRRQPVDGGDAEPWLQIADVHQHRVQRSGVGLARAMGPRPRHNNKLVCPVPLARAAPHLHKTLAEFLAGCVYLQRSPRRCLTPCRLGGSPAVPSGKRKGCVWSGRWPRSFARGLGGQSRWVACTSYW